MLCTVQACSDLASDDTASDDNFASGVHVFAFWAPKSQANRHTDRQADRQTERETESCWAAQGF